MGELFISITGYVPRLVRGIHLMAKTIEINFNKNKQPFMA
jgi:hypothetical protein